MRRYLALIVLGLAVPVVGQSPPELHFVPQHPSVSDRITVLIEGAGCPLVFGKIEMEVGRITLSASSPNPPCGAEPWAFELSLGRLEAGSYVVSLEVDEDPALEHALTVKPPDQTVLFFQSSTLPGDYRATVEWTFPGTTVPQAAYPVTISPEAGYFWFFDPDNPEVTLKIVDGSLLNGHAWLFLSSLTTLPFTLTLSNCPGDPPICTDRTYRYPGGRGRLILDLTLE